MKCQIYTCRVVSHDNFARSHHLVTKETHNKYYIKSMILFHDTFLLVVCSTTVFQIQIVLRKLMWREDNVGRFTDVTCAGQWSRWFSLSPGRNVFLTCLAAIFWQKKIHETSTGQWKRHFRKQKPHTKAKAWWVKGQCKAVGQKWQGIWKWQPASLFASGHATKMAVWIGRETES